jgi:hypothetical protein
MNKQVVQDAKSPKNHRVSDTALINIEAALNLIPFACGFLATYFGEIRSKRADERMRNFFNYFTRELKKIDEQKIDKTYLQSEEFAELFAQGAEQAARSTTTKRMERFANILIHNALLTAKARSRTHSIMSFIDRISDLDAFVLLCFGNPALPSLRAKTKKDAFLLVEQLTTFLHIDCPSFESVIESIVYMDNLGITWVNEKSSASDSEKGKDIILKEFSCFRSPLGDAVASVIAPPRFYKQDVSRHDTLIWPMDHIR